MKEKKKKSGKETKWQNKQEQNKKKKEHNERLIKEWNNEISEYFWTKR